MCQNIEFKGNLGVRNQLSAETSYGYPPLCVSDSIIAYLWDELADCEAEKDITTGDERRNP